MSPIQASFILLKSAVLNVPLLNKVEGFILMTFSWLLWTKLKYGVSILVRSIGAIGPRWHYWSRIYARPFLTQQKSFQSYQCNPSYHPGPLLPPSERIHSLHWSLNILRVSIIMMHKNKNSKILINSALGPFFIELKQVYPISRRRNL